MSESDVIIEHEREPIAAPTIERQGEPATEGETPNDGLSEYERHAISRGFRKPPNRPAPSKPTKPAINAQGPPKAGQAPGETQPAAEGVTAEGAEPAAQAGAQTPPVDSGEHFVDPDTHDRYDGRTKAAKRIKTLLSERGRVRDENHALRSELADLRRQLADTSSGPAHKPTYPASGQPPAQAAANPDDPQPQLDQFQSWDEYQRAVTRWEVRQELQQHTSKTQQEQARSQERERFQQNLTTHQARVAKATERFPDMLDKLAQIPAIPATQHVVRTIIESEIGPEIGYYLGSHPEILRQLLEQPTEAAHLRMLGRIEADVEKTVRGQAQPATSRAPAPTRPVAGSGSAAVTGQGPAPGQESVQEWRSKRGMGPSINRH